MLNEVIATEADIFSIKKTNIILIIPISEGGLLVSVEN